MDYLSVFAFIGFGIAVGILLQSNYRLRQEVHLLRAQVADNAVMISSLTQMITNRGEDVAGR